VVDTSLDWRANAVFIGPGGTPPPPANVAPTAAFTVSCDGLVCDVDATDSADPDGEVASYEWSFGDGATATTRTARHTYAADGSYTITLRVTDDRGAVGTATKQVQVADVPPPASPIAFRASASAAADNKFPSVTIPGSVRAGDLMVLVGSYREDGTVSDPAGWTRVDATSTTAIQSVVWTRVVAAADAGTQVRTPLSVRLKSALTLGVYANGARVLDSASSVDARTTDHRSPTLQVPAGSWVVQAWADKSSGTTAWTPPAGVQVREEALGTGGGRITALYADSGAPVAAGQAGGLVAVTDDQSARSIAWTLALAPGD